MDLSCPIYAYRTCKLALSLIYANEYWRHIFLGFLLETNHDWEGALAEYTLSLTKNDTTDEKYTAVFNVACMYLFQQLFTPSVTYFKQALQIQEKGANSKHSMALCLNNIAVCLTQEPDGTTNATKYHTQAIKMFPQFVRAYQSQIEGKMEAGKFKSALKDCDTVLEITKHDKTLSEIYVQKASCAQSSEQSLKYARMAVKYDPTSASACILLSRVTPPSKDFNPRQYLLDSMVTCNTEIDIMRIYSRLCELENSVAGIKQNIRIIKAMSQHALARVS
jgi:hypothetical protein